jgi:hypothetical protein
LFQPENYNKKRATDLVARVHRISLINKNAIYIWPFLLTLNSTSFDLLGKFAASPTYFAFTSYSPLGNTTLKVAVPLMMLALPMTRFSSPTNTTTPVGLFPLTFAVSSAGDPSLIMPDGPDRVVFVVVLMLDATVTAVVALLPALQVLPA